MAMFDSWLQYSKAVVRKPKDHQDRQVFALLAWTLQCCGVYFRTLYKSSMFLTLDDAKLVVESGWKTLDPVEDVQLFVEFLNRVNTNSHSGSWPYVRKDTRCWRKPRHPDNGCCSSCARNCTCKHIWCILGSKQIGCRNWGLFEVSRYETSIRVSNNPSTKVAGSMGPR